MLPMHATTVAAGLGTPNAAKAITALTPLGSMTSVSPLARHLHQVRPLTAEAEAPRPAVVQRTPGQRGAAASQALGTAEQYAEVEQFSAQQSGWLQQPGLRAPVGGGAAAETPLPLRPAEGVASPGLWWSTPAIQTGRAAAVESSSAQPPRTSFRQQVQQRTEREPATSLVVSRPSPQTQPPIRSQQHAGHQPPPTSSLEEQMSHMRLQRTVAVQEPRPAAFQSLGRPAGPTAAPAAAEFAAADSSLLSWATPKAVPLHSALPQWRPMAATVSAARAQGPGLLAVQHSRPDGPEAAVDALTAVSQEQGRQPPHAIEPAGPADLDSAASTPVGRRPQGGWLGCCLVLSWRCIPNIAPSLPSPADLAGMRRQVHELAPEIALLNCSRPAAAVFHPGQRPATLSTHSQVEAALDCLRGLQHEAAQLLSEDKDSRCRTREEFDGLSLYLHVEQATQWRAIKAAQQPAQRQGPSAAVLSRLSQLKQLTVQGAQLVAAQVA